MEKKTSKCDKCGKEDNCLKVTAGKGEFEYYNLCSNCSAELSKRLQVIADEFKKKYKEEMGTKAANCLIDFMKEKENE